jgi:hypothetical protein
MAWYIIEVAFWLFIIWIGGWIVFVLLLMMWEAILMMWEAIKDLPRALRAEVELWRWMLRWRRR